MLHADTSSHVLLLLVTSAPAVCMAVGSYSVLWIKTSPRTQAIFQNFSAGMLIAAVAGELFPLMASGPKAYSAKDRTAFRWGSCSW